MPPITMSKSRVVDVFTYSVNWIGLGCASTPTFRHDSDRTWIVVSRALLPTFVMTSKLRRTPSFTLTPSGPSFQPAWSSVSAALLGSYVYLGTLLVSAHDVGGSTVVATFACLKYTRSASAVRSTAWYSAWRTCLPVAGSPKIFPLTGRLAFVGSMLTA